MTVAVLDVSILAARVDILQVNHLLKISPVPPESQWVSTCQHIFLDLYLQNSTGEDETWQGFRAAQC